MNIPAQLYSDVAPDSNYLRFDSEHGKKDLRNLFRMPMNQKYLEYQLISGLTDKHNISKIMLKLNIYKNSETLSKLFSDNKKMIKQFVDVFSHKLPDPEYLSATNPVEQLSYINTQYLLESSRSIIMNPSIIVDGYYDIDPYNGWKKTSNIQEYGPSSYSDGYWHPENLFLDTPWNRNREYWKPLNITFSPNIPSKSPGHRYNSSVYGGGYRTDKKFQRQNYNNRHYDYGDEGLAESGKGDRRTQYTRGYDMSDLINKPS